MAVVLVADAPFAYVCDSFFLINAIVFVVNLNPDVRIFRVHRSQIPSPHLVVLGARPRTLSNFVKPFSLETVSE